MVLLILMLIAFLYPVNSFLHPLEEALQDTIISIKSNSD